jgi:hypothetical protein
MFLFPWVLVEVVPQLLRQHRLEVQRHLLRRVLRLCQRLREKRSAERSNSPLRLAARHQEPLSQAA